MRHRSLYPLLLFIITLAGLSVPLDLSAQRRFPVQLDLDSRLLDTLHTPDATSTRHRYRITAWGTYSMWEDTLNSSVDPMWIYSFPQEEWAKPEWRIFTEGYPIYVGDTRLLDAHGFRINNRPMPQQALRSDHTYSMVVQGDGRPISASIVDWNFRDLYRRDAHGNNSGWLHVNVEELPLYEYDICAIDSSAFPRIRLSLKLYRDSVRTDIPPGGILIRENGIPVRIEDIDCSERSSTVSVAMVFDRSGSMDEPFGGSTRMHYTRDAGRRFVDHISDADEAAVYSFSLGNTLDQSWTNSRPLLKDAINRLAPDGWTAMNDAVLRAINEIQLRPAERRKAIVVLSDGEDNRSVVRDISTVIRRAREVGVPVFAIGLLLDSDDSLRLLASGTGGRYFAVTDPAAMDSVFASIAEIVFEKGCCSVWYTSPDTRRDGRWRWVLPTIITEGDSIGGRPGGYSAPRGTSSMDNSSETDGVEISALAPNPSGTLTTVEYRIVRSGTVTIDILDVTGSVVAHIASDHSEPGTHTRVMDVSGLAPGRYFLRISVPGESRLQSLIVAR